MNTFNNNIPYYSGNYTTKEFIMNMQSSIKNYHYIRDILTYLVKSKVNINFTLLTEDVIRALCKYGGIKGDLNINFIDRNEVSTILKEHYKEIKEDWRKYYKVRISRGKYLLTLFYSARVLINPSRVFLFKNFLTLHIKPIYNDRNNKNKD